jgi:hypothetical protein
MMLKMINTPEMPAKNRNIIVAVASLEHDTINGSV